MRGLTEQEFLKVGSRTLSENEYSEYLELSKEVESVDAFQWNGELFFGDFSTIYRLYKIENPSKKFRIWLIDKGFQINQ